MFLFDRSPHQQGRQENIHPLENFDSFETFEVSTQLPPENSGRQEDYNSEVPNNNNNNYNSEVPNNNNNNNYNNEVLNNNYNNEPKNNNYNEPQDNNYVEEPQQQQQQPQEQPQDDYLDPPQQDDYLEPPKSYNRSPPSPYPPPQPQTRDPYLVTIPKVNEVKTTVDGNRGVKTRVYTRITDVTTVGGDGENENEVEEKLDPENQQQRHDEPNIISNIIDQVLTR